MTNHEQYNLEHPSQPINISEQDQTDFNSSGNVLETSKTVIVKNKHTMDDKEWSTTLGQRFGRTEFSTLVLGSVYSVATSDYLIAITHLSYAPSVGLPDAQLVGPGKSYIVKDEAGGAGTTTITVRSAGERNIDGSATATITSNYGTVRLYTDGANWFTR